MCVLVFPSSDAAPVGVGQEEESYPGRQDMVLDLIRCGETGGGGFASLVGGADTDRHDRRFLVSSNAPCKKETRKHIHTHTHEHHQPKEGNSSIPGAFVVREWSHYTCNEGHMPLFPSSFPFISRPPPVNKPSPLL